MNGNRCGWRAAAGRWIRIACLWNSGAFFALGQTAAGDGGGFTDVTAASGVEEILKQHQQTYREFVLNDMYFVDVDGDGALDLHLGDLKMCVAAMGRNDGKRHFRYVDPKPAISRHVSSRGRGWKGSPGAIPAWASVEEKIPDVPYPGGKVYLAADVNEDGKIDLFTGHGDPDLYPLCGGDAGHWLYENHCQADGQPAWTFRAALEMSGAVKQLADVNRDGIVDYVTGGWGIQTGFGKGDGTFAAVKPLIPMPPKDTEAYERASLGWRGSLNGARTGPLLADINGDGRLEALVMTGCFFWGGTAPWKRQIFACDDKGENWRDITEECGLDAEGTIEGVGDVNNDGYPDLICVDSTCQGVNLKKERPRETLCVWLNDGKGHFHRGPVPVGDAGEFGVTSGRGGAIVTDFDNDGVADIVFVDFHRTSLLKGTGGGGFEYANRKWGLRPCASRAGCAAWGTWTGTGDWTWPWMAGSTAMICLRGTG